MYRQQICLHAPSLSRALEFLALGFEWRDSCRRRRGRLTRDSLGLGYHRLVSVLPCGWWLVPAVGMLWMHARFCNLRFPGVIVLEVLFLEVFTYGKDRCRHRKADRAVLKPRWLRVIPIGSSATMADRAVLKPVGVDMPFDLGIPISKNCKICQVFLFLRPARSFFRSGSRISASVYSRSDHGMGTL